MTTLICIRHGQSEINLARRLTGQLDSPLTPLGVEQARRTAEFLRSQPITRIYSSDLVRCMDTAAPTAAMHGLPVIPEPAFREIFAGKWEGMTFDAITAAYPESHHVWMTDMGRAHPDGGESVAQLYDRVTAAMERVVRETRAAVWPSSPILPPSAPWPAAGRGCRWSRSAGCPGLPTPRSPLRTGPTANTPCACMGTTSTRARA